jgi:hypothetical protein
MCGHCAMHRIRPMLLVPMEPTVSSSTMGLGSQMPSSETSDEVKNAMQISTLTRKLQDPTYVSDPMLTIETEIPAHYVSSLRTVREFMSRHLTVLSNGQVQGFPNLSASNITDYLFSRMIRLSPLVERRRSLMSLYMKMRRPDGSVEEEPPKKRSRIPELSRKSPPKLRPPTIQKVF